MIFSCGQEQGDSKESKPLEEIDNTTEIHDVKKSQNVNIVSNDKNNLNDGSAYHLSNVKSGLSSASEKLVFSFITDSTKKGEVIDSFTNRGNATAIDSLVTFFHLSAKDALQDVIAMHYVEDGSREFISNMLAENPTAFSGSINLVKITIEDVYRIGDHNFVAFQLEDNTGQTANWYEDFVCKNGFCFKSNYINFIGDTPASNFINSFIRKKKHSLTTVPKSDTRLVFNLDEEYFGSNNPFEVSVDVVSIEVDLAAKKSNWYSMLEDIEKFRTTDIEETRNALNAYLPKVFEDWDSSKSLFYRFGLGSTEAEWLALNLSSGENFEPAYYIENGKHVWIYAHSDNPVSGQSIYIFCFDKDKNKFITDPYKQDGAYFFMSRLLEKELFPEELTNENENAE